MKKNYDFIFFQINLLVIKKEYCEFILYVLLHIVYQAEVSVNDFIIISKLNSLENNVLTYLLCFCKSIHELESQYEIIFQRVSESNTIDSKTRQIIDTITQQLLPETTKTFKQLHANGFQLMKHC